MSSLVRRSVLPVELASSQAAQDAANAATYALRSHFAGYACPSDAPYLADRTGVVDATAAFVACISGNDNTIVLPGVYSIATTVSIAATGSNKTIYFMPGVRIVSSAAATNALTIFQFLGTADRLRIIGNGAQLSYAATPTSRLYHAVYVRGAAITNLEIEGLDVRNGGNMAIAIFCGNDGTVASGSKNICVHDCKLANTLGDGVHVENADAGVRIYDIDSDNSGDDVVAVINYVGTGGAPTHPTPTVGVLVKGIRARNANTSFVSVAGIQEFVIDDIQGEANAAATVFGINFAKGSGYTVGNANGTIDNVVGTNVTKLLTLDAGGSSSASFNRDMRIGKLVGHGIKNVALSMSNGSAASGGAIKNIEIDQLELHGAAGSTVGYISQTLNCRIGSLLADGFATGLGVYNNVDFGWGMVKLQGFLASTTTAFTVTGNTNIRAGALELNGTNCTTGLQFQSNSGVTHDGLWAVSNAGTNFQFGSNSSVRGYFDLVGEYRYIGAVTAGSQSTVTYPRAVPAGAAFVPTITSAANEALRWGCKNIAAASMTLLWTDAQNAVYVNYQIAMQAA